MTDFLDEAADATPQPVSTPRPTKTRCGRLAATVAVIALLTTMALLAVSSLVQKSATFDEPMYITGGHVYWTTGDAWMANRFHPVFAPLWVGLGTLAFDLMPRDDPTFAASLEDTEGYNFGLTYFYRNSEPSESILLLARLPMVLLGVLLGWAVYAWSAALFGRAGGMLSLVLYVFAPNILAHARLATTDFPITAFSFLTLYFFWRFVRRRERWAILPTGICFGLAMLSKFTAVILLPLMAITVLVEALVPRPRREDARDDPERSATYRLAGFALALIAVFALGLVVIAAGYRFDFSTGGDVVDVVTAHRESKAPLGLPAATCLRTLNVLPVPTQYVDTVAWAFDKNRDGHPAFLCGERADSGWWSYFPIAFAVKTTIPFMLLVVIGGVFLLARRSREALFLLLPAAAFFAAGMMSTVNIGFRHVLPIMPLLFVAVGAMLEPRRSKALFALIVVIAAGLAGWHALESVSVYPDYLAYFNQYAGGPQNGWRYLVDSNLDWGQDAGRIGARLRKLGIDEEVRLAVFGSVDRETFHFPHRQVLYSVRPKPGVYVVSATELQDVYGNPERFAWLRDNFTPVDTIGHSIFIFRITEEDLSGPTPDLEPEDPDILIGE